MEIQSKMNELADLQQYFWNKWARYLMILKFKTDYLTL